MISWPIPHLVQKCFEDLKPEQVAIDLGDLRLEQYSECFHLFGCDGDWLASFAMMTFPGNEKIYVSLDAYVHEHYRRRGIHTFLQKLKQAIARAHGAKLMMCTIRSDNAIQRLFLSNRDWTFVESFTNDDHVVEVWTLEL